MLFIPSVYGEEYVRVFKVVDDIMLASQTDAECEIIEMDNINNDMLIVANCPIDTAAQYGFQQDLIIMADDLDVNNAVGANILHFANNVGGGRVAIVDSGINYNHKELVSSYVGGYDFVNNDNDPIDDNGHGTFIAGIITADGINPNAKGISPKAEIVAMKVLDSSGVGFLSDSVRAIYYIIDGPDGIYGTDDDFDVDVINLSIGSLIKYKQFCDDVFPDFTDAIEYARSKGVIVVSSAGNSGTEGMSLPGCISNSLTVGAITYNDEPTFFTSIGEAVDISTIGVNVFSTTIHGYNIRSGTSISAPIVSGAITLLKNAYPSYTIDEIEDRLLKNTIDIHTPGKDNYTGWGKLDIYEASKELKLILNDHIINNNESVDITCFEEPAHPTGNKGNITITRSTNSYGGGIVQFIPTDYDNDNIKDIIFSINTNDPYFGLNILNPDNYIVECNILSNDTTRNDIEHIMESFYVAFFVVSESSLGTIFLITIPLLIVTAYIYKRRLFMN